LNGGVSKVPDMLALFTQSFC